MSHTPHELAEEFPDKTEAIHRLKTENSHFARLADEYHAINRQIHRIEAGIEGVGEPFEKELRKTRMRLKDEIASMLARA